MKCPVCHQSPPAVGLLCQECSDELVGPHPIAAEQIVHHPAAQLTEAALVDACGRVHRLGRVVTIGREAAEPGIQVLDASVSRLHARVTLDDGTWTIVDLGSKNGTVLDDAVVGREPVPLRDGGRIRAGVVGFYFLASTAGLSPRRYERAGSETTPAPMGPPSRATAEVQSPTWMPTVAITLHEPTGGGGCVAEIDGKQIQLTMAQHELMKLLLDRLLIEADEEEHVRGFVAMSELLSRVSLDSSDANVRQLVRRLRRSLERAGIPDLIESRHGRGYRLRIKPRM